MERDSRYNSRRFCRACRHGHCKSHIRKCSSCHHLQSLVHLDHSSRRSTYKGRVRCASASKAMDDSSPTSREQRPAHRPPAPPGAFDNQAYQPDDDANRQNRQNDANHNHAPNESFGGNGDVKHEDSDRKEPYEAVNLELINLAPKNGVNGRDIPPKKDVEVDMNSTNPYDEYFVPVNEHKKYMRGEKLYVTADKRSKGGNKRQLCWTVGILLLLGAILIAILAATGVIFTSTATPVSHYNSTVSSARALGGLGATFDHSHHEHEHMTEQTSEINDDFNFSGEVPEESLYVPKTVEGVLKIDNEEFKLELMDEFSETYREFTSTLSEAITKALFPSGTGDNDIRVVITDLSPGSVIVTYRIHWIPKQNTNPADPITYETLNQRLNEYLQQNRRMLNIYHIAEDNLASKRVFDLCQNEKNDCEYGCEFDNHSLDFKCTCPADKVPDMKDPKKCVLHMDNSLYMHHSNSTEDTNDSQYRVLSNVEDEIEQSHEKPKPEVVIDSTEIFDWMKTESSIPENVRDDLLVNPIIKIVTDPNYSVPTAEPEPTSEPNAEPITEPKSEPTAEPKAEPTAEPKAEPTAEPEAEPTVEPNTEPTAEPNSEPTAEPKAKPTAEPKAEPTAKSEAESTAEPKAEPTAEPKVEPTAEPKAEPTAEPNAEPTPEPNAEPMPEPKSEPTAEPKSDPTTKPEIEVTTQLNLFLTHEPAESKPEPTHQSLENIDENVSSLTESVFKLDHKEAAELEMTSQSVAKQTSEPAPEPNLEPTPEPKAEPAPESKAEPVLVPTAQTRTEHIIEPEHKAEPVLEFKAKTSTEPHAEPPRANESIKEHNNEPNSEPKPETTSELNTERSSEPKPEPKSEPQPELTGLKPEMKSTQSKVIIGSYNSKSSDELESAIEESISGGIMADTQETTTSEIPFEDETEFHPAVTSTSYEKLIKSLKESKIDRNRMSKTTSLDFLEKGSSGNSESDSQNDMEISQNHNQASTAFVAEMSESNETPETKSNKKIKFIASDNMSIDGKYSESLGKNYETDAMTSEISTISDYSYTEEEFPQSTESKIFVENEKTGRTDSYNEEITKFVGSQVTMTSEESTRSPDREDMTTNLAQSNLNTDDNDSKEHIESNNFILSRKSEKDSPILLNSKGKSSEEDTSTEINKSTIFKNPVEGIMRDNVTGKSEEESKDITFNSIKNVIMPDEASHSKKIINESTKKTIDDDIPRTDLGTAIDVINITTESSDWLSSVIMNETTDINLNSKQIYESQAIDKNHNSSELYTEKAESHEFEKPESDFESNSRENEDNSDSDYLINTESDEPHYGVLTDYDSATYRDKRLEQSSSQSDVQPTQSIQPTVTDKMLGDYIYQTANRTQDKTLIDLLGINSSNAMTEKQEIDIHADNPEKEPAPVWEQSEIEPEQVFYTNEGNGDDDDQTVIEINPKNEKSANPSISTANESESQSNNLNVTVYEIPSNTTSNTKEESVHMSDSEEHDVDMNPFLPELDNNKSLVKKLQEGHDLEPSSVNDTQNEHVDEMSAVEKHSPNIIMQSINITDKLKDNSEEIRFTTEPGAQEHSIEHFNKEAAETSENIDSLNEMLNKQVTEQNVEHYKENTTEDASKLVSSTFISDISDLLSKEESGTEDDLMVNTEDTEVNSDIDLFSTPSSVSSINDLLETEQKTKEPMEDQHFSEPKDYSTSDDDVLTVLPITKPVKKLEKKPTNSYLQKKNEKSAKLQEYDLNDISDDSHNDHRTIGLAN